MAFLKSPKPKVGNSELIRASRACFTNSSNATVQVLTELVHFSLNRFTRVFDHFTEDR